MSINLVLIRKHNSSLRDERIKLDTVVVYGLMMCMKEDNPCPKYSNGDISSEIIISAGLWVFYM